VLLVLPTTVLLVLPTTVLLVLPTTVLLILLLGYGRARRRGVSFPHRILPTCSTMLGRGARRCPPRRTQRPHSVSQVLELLSKTALFLACFNHLQTQ
jgi:hypothetical protein